MTDERLAELRASAQESGLIGIPLVSELLAEVERLGSVVEDNHAERVTPPLR